MDAHQREQIEHEARRAAEAWRAGRVPTVTGAIAQARRALHSQPAAPSKVIPIGVKRG
jgi:hypothetical protein